MKEIEKLINPFPKGTAGIDEKGIIWCECGSSNVVLIEGYFICKDCGRPWQGKEK